ncbi:histone-fold-containing protein [Suillus paluster]|uniref:histone-fold-containing protein n=1 Tax=Suillus paluster TaxID=48578 RepID=UPI001B88621A|nr:histone-fold-containing protein [Suillus paluster]KAG1728737.1 histone-fold-containing protein [Suillus paluster]
MSPTTPYVQSGEPLNDFLRSFWQRQVDAAEQETPDYRHPPLPLARIKKVMKSDPDVKMIAADAPILFCKACEIFISEITARAFIIADSNKRRTLSRADIAKALAKSDQFDFLIDIVPREEGLTGLTQSAGAVAGGSGSNMTNLVAGVRVINAACLAPHQDSEHHAGDESGNMPSSVVLDQVRIVIHSVALDPTLSPPRPCSLPLLRTVQRV